MKKKLLKKLFALIGGSAILSGLGFILIIAILLCAIAGSDDTNTDISTDSIGIYEANVEAYREIITTYCKQYDNEKSQKVCGGLPNYVNAVLALMTIESHGSGMDPMQASEGAYNKQYPQVPNGIKNPQYSCQCGVQEFRDAIVMAKVSSPTDFGRLGVAVQGYNFGASRWLAWINQNGGTYTVELAEQYSREKMPAGAKGTPTHAKKFLDTYQTALAKAVDDDSENTGIGDRVVKLALTKVGCAYDQNRRMQSNPDVFDCSSFVFRIYRDTAGITFGSKNQYYAPVAADLLKWCDQKKFTFHDKKKLKPGDVIFYSRYHNGRYKNITHVSIYTGNNRIVEAKGIAWGVVTSDYSNKGVVSFAKPY